MRETRSFPIVQSSASPSPAVALPYIPIGLENGGYRVNSTGLVDSGATINVLPYDESTRLGADWNAQTTTVPLTGVLAGTDARALVVSGLIADFPSVRLAFAWTNRNDHPVILGHVNFLMEYDVCILRSRSEIEITRWK